MYSSGRTGEGQGNSFCSTCHKHVMRTSRDADLAEMLAMLGFDKFRPLDLDSIDEAQKNDTGSKKCSDSVVIITNLQAVKLYLYHHISMIANFNRHLTCLQCLLIHWGFLMACLCQAEHSCSFVDFRPLQQGREAYLHLAPDHDESCHFSSPRRRFLIQKPNTFNPKAHE